MVLRIRARLLLSRREVWDGGARSPPLTPPLVRPYGGYVGLVVLLALFLLYFVPRWRQTWDGGAWLRATGAVGGAVALGLILAGGMRVEMSRGVPADRHVSLLYASSELMGE